MRDSQGHIDTVTDEEILEAYDLLTRLDGVFCEPASAASVAGVAKWAKTRGFAKEDTVVCILTGHGLKDPDTAVRRSTRPSSVGADMDEVLGALML